MVIIHTGKVEDIYDGYNGLRIKVRLKQEDSKRLEDIPWAFPLMPKTFQTVPKIGEGAFVILTDSDDLEKTRYYLGPIIAQPQQQEFSSYEINSFGDALKLIDGGVLFPDESISNYSITNGSFPKINDVAMVGRGGQDIIMHSDGDKKSQGDSINIRCGIRTESPYSDDKENHGLKGKVIYNSADPAYIQLKYKPALVNGDNIAANSIVNLVADKINIVSNKDDNSFDLTDPNQLIPEEKLADMMSKLHQLPLGDELVKLLRLMIMAICTHVHPIGGMPACEANYVKQLVDDYSNLEDKILSKHVRIS